MITFIAHMKVRPENAAAYDDLMTMVRDQTLANEPGVAWYSFAKSAEVEDTWLVVEVYRDAAAHSAHMKTTWVVESIPKSRALVDGKFDIKQYTSPGVTPAVRQMKES